LVAVHFLGGVARAWAVPGVSYLPGAEKARGNLPYGFRSRSLRNFVFSEVDDSGSLGLVNLCLASWKEGSIRGERGSGPTTVLTVFVTKSTSKGASSSGSGSS